MLLQSNAVNLTASPSLSSDEPDAFSHASPCTESSYLTSGAFVVGSGAFVVGSGAFVVGASVGFCVGAWVGASVGFCVGATVVGIGFVGCSSPPPVPVKSSGLSGSSKYCVPPNGTFNEIVVLLLLSSTSLINPLSSTHAVTVCVPSSAVQYAPS